MGVFWAAQSTGIWTLAGIGFRSEEVAFVVSMQQVAMWLGGFWGGLVSALTYDWIPPVGFIAATLVLHEVLAMFCGIALYTDDMLREETRWSQVAKAETWESCGGLVTAYKKPDQESYYACLLDNGLAPLLPDGGGGGGCR